jgi:hypothetical protein
VPWLTLHVLNSLALAGVSACLLISMKGSRMPGFLSASGYDGTEKVDLAPGYFAEVKRCLSEEEAGFAESAMLGKVRAEMTANRQYADLDTRAGRVELVVQSLVSWNLVEEDGVTSWPLDSGIVTTPKPGVNPWPPGCPRRKSVARIPSPLFDMLWAKCNELNGPRTSDEAARFPDETERGDPDGDGGTA